VTGLQATVAERRRAVAIAGHTSDFATARAALSDPDPTVRATALGALHRLDALEPEQLVAAFTDSDPIVRRRAGEVAAHYPHVSLLDLLNDPEPVVIEVAAWSCGEHEIVADDVLFKIIDLATTHDDPLVREAAVAALGAIGDERGLPAILAGCRDKPAIRRRAVLALAPFDGDEAEAALAAALVDRDWQVRQAAEDLSAG
jgi:HEAT repeat protein